MTSASVLLHLPGRPGERELDELSDALAGLAGVARVEPGRKLRQLLLIAYDPRIVSAEALLATARHRGLAAQLVGM
jgi:hypothetical protein